MEQPTPAQPPAIEVHGLRKTFAARAVLDGIDLTVRRGQVFGYVGPNGAGKSTTVRILAGLLTPFVGEVRVAGFDVRAAPIEIKRRIGYLPENAQLYEVMTVREHLLFVGRLHGLRDATTLSRAKAMLEAFGIGARVHSRLAALSKGMRQKVMISSVLLHDPEILFLDEPLSGLDVQSAVLLKEVIRALADRGRTVFYCSHMMDVVERVCDRIAVIADGRIVAQGSFEELSAANERGMTLEKIFLQLTSDGEESLRAERILDALESGG